MGIAQELIVGTLSVAAGDTLEDLDMLAGNSKSLRAAAQDTPISLISAWGTLGGIGEIQIRSPLMHDNVMGYTAPLISGTTMQVWPTGVIQPLFSHDDLTLRASSGTLGDEVALAMVVHYVDLPGAAAQLISGDEVRTRTQHVLTVINDLSAGSINAWQGEETLNAQNDLLKSGRKYALLGCTTSIDQTCIRWRSSDWANLGVGVPCNMDTPELSANWFVHMSDATGIPLIPVIDSDNVGAVLIDKYNISVQGITVGTTLALLAE